MNRKSFLGRLLAGIVAAPAAVAAVAVAKKTESALIPVVTGKTDGGLGFTYTWTAASPNDAWMEYALEHARNSEYTFVWKDPRAS